MRAIIGAITIVMLVATINCGHTKQAKTPLVLKERIVVYESEVQAAIDSLQLRILKCEAVMDECCKIVEKMLKKDGN